jgi:hypothetical protein
MQKQSAKAEQVYLAVGAIVGWFAVVSQLYLQIVNRLTPLPEAIIRFFSYFTILTNLLIAFCYTILLLKPDSDWGKLFSRPRVLTAITVYITVVGITYNTLLRQLWNPQGLQWFVDVLLHSVVPILFILYWLIFVIKNELQWKNILPWIIYPVVYLLYALFRGALSGFYPYPFIDVNAIGYTKVFINATGLITGFLLLSLLFVAVGKLMSRKPS